MPRAEDDAFTANHGPEFNDPRSEINNDRQQTMTANNSEHWVPGAPGSGQPDDASRGLDGPDHERQKANPSHGTAKDAGAPPKGAGDGELQEQPGSTSEARQPGADNPKFDE